MHTATRVFILAVIAVLVGTAARRAPDLLQWSSIQLFRSVFGRTLLCGQLDSIERSIWLKWEEDHRKESESAASYLLDIPEVTSLSGMARVDLARPFLARNMSRRDVLTIEDMLTAPLSELRVDYFSDARRKNTVPDAVGAVGEIASKIVAGGPEKLGTQMILKAFPTVMDRFLNENAWLVGVFGQKRVDTWRRLGPTVTVPVFMSRGRSTGPGETLSGTTRTDLHCEPISNLVAQTVGEKAWTLIEPRHSHLLRPTVAPDGRAYFYSSLDPFDPKALAHVPRYEVITKAGDVLYVPTWTWHRVQYLPDVTAVSISLFEFVSSDFVSNNALFAVSLIPNLFKELIGIKTQ